MNFLSLFKVYVTLFLSFFYLTAFSQTNTSASGNWNTGGNWSSGVPAGGSIANVDHTMTLDVNISISGGGYYTINSPVTDIAGGTAYTLSLTGSGSHGVLEVNSDMTFEGACNVNSKGEIIVRSGATLTIGAAVFANGSFVTVDPGGTLIINGDVTNNNNSTNIVINGNLIVNGDFTGGNGSILSGSGNFTATGTISTGGSGSVFGSSSDCNTGPCSGNNLCSFTNTITAAQSICYGQTPATLTGATNGASPVYLWQVCTTSSSGTYTTVTGTSNAADYSPGALTANTWYRRKVTSGTCTAISTPLQITVNALPATPTISAGSSTTFCSGCNVTLTSSVANAYSWSTGATTSSIVVNTTGSYSVTITDVNGCKATSSATAVTVNTCISHTWTGSSSSAWSTASNWNKCAAPGSTDDVTVPNVTTAPVISATSNCRNLTINSSASTTINSGITLNIYGNVTNNGTYTDNGTTNLSGLSAQSITGTISFNNLTVSNASGVTLNNATTVNGILTLTSGTLASGGNLTVNLNTGAIAGTGAGNISGTITTLKTVNSNKYHMVSSPLSGLTANDWNDDVRIQSGSYANFYSYDETNADTSKSLGWTAQTSLAAPLTSLQGFALYFTGVTSLDQTGSYTHSATYSNTLTNTVSNTGGATNPSADGWNLVGNPYPSTLDWSAASGWTKTNLDNAIYMYDPLNSRYTSFVSGIGTNGGTRYIPSMQGFWVKVSAAGTGTLALTNSVRVTSTNPSIWRTASTSDILKLTASSAGYSDETIIRFIDDAIDSFDNELDAYKMDNEDNTPSLYTQIGNDLYSINSLPYSSKNLTIPVKLSAAFTGSYTFSVQDIESFTSNDSIIFEDKLLGVKQDLRYHPNYTCPVSQRDTTGRFYLSFREGIASNLNLKSPLHSSIIIKGIDDHLNIQFVNENSNTATIGVYTTFGEQIFKVEKADITTKEYSIQPPAASNGIYIVKVVTDSQATSEKVYLMR